MAQRGSRDRGLIPAHAGKTREGGRARLSTRAHPRSRGENAIFMRPAVIAGGSSPLTRGKLDLRIGKVRRRGLIPAHAGKTRARRAPMTLSRAHPRSRGENDATLQSIEYAEGSSPLTRGKRLETEHVARARVAHPRSRGENFLLGHLLLLLRGSSPLTRGKHFLTCAFIAQIGQILESRELCASSESYSLRNVYATDAPQDQVRSIGLAPLSSRGAS